MEHVNRPHRCGRRRIGHIRLTDIPACTRVRVEGSPGIEINTHVGTSGIDHKPGAVSSPTAARAVNVHRRCLPGSEREILAAHESAARPTTWRGRAVGNPDAMTAPPSAAHRRPSPGAETHPAAGRDR